jgi:hypothetical protein
MKYGFIEEHREMYRIASMCAVLKTSRSGYYAWRNRQPSRRRIDNQELLGHIRQVHTRSRKLYGSPRITAELNEQGFKCGKNRVARIMKDHSICAEVKKRRFRRTTDSRHDYALAANLLIDQGQTEGVWASDITFVPTSEGWLYVAAVMNVKSRSTRLGSGLVFKHFPSDCCLGGKRNVEIQRAVAQIKFAETLRKIAKLAQPNLLNLNMYFWTKFTSPHFLLWATARQNLTPSVFDPISFSYTRVLSRFSAPTCRLMPWGSHAIVYART